MRDDAAAEHATSEVTAAGPEAVSAAESVLDAFYQQDQRELHLIRGDADAAMRAQERANVGMTRAFAAEFPTISTAAAEQAGTRFMHALYLQDEIENWEYVVEQRSNPGIEELLFTEGSVPAETRQSSDPRWDCVEGCLEEVCSYTGIDPEYAVCQTRFWKLHGGVEDYWRQDALDAHRLKLRSMIPGAAESTIESLAETFVDGVAIHDDWTHQDREADLERVLDMVANYYQRVFDVRAVEG
ncbi:hypothetical protein JCM30237_14450 [Halolamina litorea]|uniref:Uncharacterized protein n=1 Tax=Halolamina litorea TaxID=1515593 RepID=A0ABD6BNS5_9EURY|nr:hypothetical protein [Halolamina litorea]